MAKNATGVDKTTEGISVSWMDFVLKLIPRGSGRWRLEMGELRKPHWNIRIRPEPARKTWN